MREKPRRGVLVHGAIAGPRRCARSRALAGHSCIGNERLLYDVHMAARTKTNTSGMIALGYVRVSTAEQGKSGLGTEAQRAAIKAECTRRGWRLQSVAIDVASGKSTNGRHKLKETLTALDRGEAHVLVA